MHTNAFVNSAVLSESPKLWRRLSVVMFGATFALMFLGAFTRASMAGLSCPDWPLCHGYVVPPTADGAYPPAPMYTALKVYLEFGHRVLASVVALGAVGLGIHAWRRRARHVAIALWTVLGLQIGMGAVTVFLKNQPFTVVVHLALAIAFLSVLLLIHQRVVRPKVRPAVVHRADAVLSALVLVQLLIGASISSRHFGLACVEFPLCLDGRLLPERWSIPLVWQAVHRTTALGLVVGLLALFGHRLCLGELEPLRRAAFALMLVLVQVSLGAMNVWLRVPPWASALHLAVGVALLAVLASNLTASLPTPKLAVPRRSAEARR